MRCLAPVAAPASATASAYFLNFTLRERTVEHVFVGEPSEPLPPLASSSNPLRATHNKDGVRPLRQNHRAVPGAKFCELKELRDVLDQLFGDLPSNHPCS